MNDSQPANRVRIWIFIAMLATLALGSFWLLEVLRKSGDDTVPNTARSEPDYYVENFSYIRMAKSGQARYNISGQKLTHLPKNDTYEIQLPIVNTLDSSQAPMSMRAQRALVEHESNKVHMYDQVHVDRPATAKAEHLQIRSEYLLILPDDEVMQSDKRVDITLDQSTLTGVGMYANNATREFRLDGKVHGTYQAPVKR